MCNWVWLEISYGVAGVGLLVFWCVMEMQVGNWKGLETFNKVCVHLVQV